jgi:hypothetical protein
LHDTTWSTLHTFPSSSSSTLPNDTITNTLLNDLASGTSSCQVDHNGNFVWISSQSAVKSTTPSGIHFTVDPAATRGLGTWSVIHTSSQPDDKEGDPPNVNTLFSIAEDVFVHAAITETGVRLALLSGNNLIQSNRIWSLVSVCIGPRVEASALFTLEYPARDQV